MTSPPRGIGLRRGSFTHWTMNAVIAQLFPIIAARSGGFPFAVFAVLMAGQLLWVLYVMPETKGVPLKRMRDRLNMPPRGERTPAATA